MNNRVKIFVSYSHFNEDWVCKGRKYGLINWLENQLCNIAEFWIDHALKELPGEEYEKLITENIEIADIAILLISQEFVRSEFIQSKELPLIKERFFKGHLYRIIPIWIMDLTPNGKESIDWVFKLQVNPDGNVPLINYTENSISWEKAKIGILGGIENVIDNFILNKKNNSDVNKESDEVLTEDQHETDNSKSGNNSEEYLFRSKGVFYDERDLKEYNWIKIGSQIWFAENLAFKMDKGCWLYDDKEYNEKEYGYLYDWQSAFKACPKGWRLPNEDDWRELIDYLITNGYNYNSSHFENKIAKSLAHNRGWTKTTGRGQVGCNQTENNRTGFSALPGGYREEGINLYDRLYEYGYWWCTPKDPTDDAYRICLCYYSNSFNKENCRKKEAYSVRCIKE